MLTLESDKKKRYPRAQRKAETGNKMKAASSSDGETEQSGLLSLPVKNVQDLAADPLTIDGLQRYERPEINDHPVLSEGDSGEIPVIDFSSLLDPQLYDEAAMKLHHACQDWGFFQLVSHGISNELVEKTKVVIKEFFQLPLEEKEVFAQLPGDLEGYGQIFAVSDEQKLDWADMFLLRTQPVRIRKMNFWPTKPNAFRDTLDEYTLELKEVAYKLFEIIAKNLGVESKKFADRFETQTVRINYYPPCPHADKVLGLSPHSDAVGITLILQINEVCGLQIRKNDAWVPIKPLPGAHVVNIGDVLEVLSNGKYKSIEHRVVIDPKKERLSIATFHNVMNSMVGPLPEIVKGSKENYRTMSHADFMKIYYSSKLDGKNLIDYVKLKN